MRTDGADVGPGRARDGAAPFDQPMAMTPEERRARAKVAAHTSWANTRDRSARTARARAGLEAKFEREADPEGVLSPRQRAERADSLRKAHYARMALAAAKARRRKGR